MKTYTVTAQCRLAGGNPYTLRHDGEDWREKPPYEETTFDTREAAQAFADRESKTFEVSHSMEIHESDDES